MSMKYAKLLSIKRDEKKMQKTKKIAILYVLLGLMMFTIQIASVITKIESVGYYDDFTSLAKKI